MMKPPTPTILKTYENAKKNLAANQKKFDLALCNTGKHNAENLFRYHNNVVAYGYIVRELEKAYDVKAPEKERKIDKIVQEAIQQVLLGEDEEVSWK